MIPHLRNVFHQNKILDKNEWSRVFKDAKVKCQLKEPRDIFKFEERWGKTQLSSGCNPTYADGREPLHRFQGLHLPNKIKDYITKDAAIKVLEHINLTYGCGDLIKLYKSL